jgi:hypothetical protein
MVTVSSAFRKLCAIRPEEPLPLRESLQFRPGDGSPRRHFDDQ